MTGLYLAGYYTSLRKLHAGDQTGRISHAVIGTGDDPLATEFTAPHAVPITAMTPDPDSPRHLLIAYRFPRGTMPEGMIIREIGLRAADGTALLRRLFTHGVEVSSDLEISDQFRMEV